MELLLSRLERDSPPSHLADLGIAQIGENYGRERRYKYFTIANYRKVAVQEGFDEPDPRYLSVDLSSAEDFMPVEQGLFYSTEKDLEEYINNSHRGSQITVGKSKKAKVYKNPLLPDGTVKKGRPRKSDVATDAGGQNKAKTPRGKKRKHDGSDEEGGTEQDAVSKKKRGPSPAPETNVSEHTEASERQKEEIDKTSPQRKRGRPRKHPLPNAAPEERPIAQEPRPENPRRSTRTAKPKPVDEGWRGQEDDPSSMIVAKLLPEVERQVDGSAVLGVHPHHEVDRNEDTARLQILSEVSVGLTSTRLQPSASNQDPMESDESSFRQDTAIIPDSANEISQSRESIDVSLVSTTS